jgi:hypothetical protein
MSPLYMPGGNNSSLIAIGAIIPTANILCHKGFYLFYRTFGGEGYL